MEKFQIPFCEEFTHSIEFKTSIVSHFDGTEQRQALWLNPKRSFRLDFEATPPVKTALEAFFCGQKGDADMFRWRWEEAQSGTGLDYCCYFDGPKISQNILPLAYAKTSLTLVAIDDNNILKGRYFDRTDVWQLSGNVSISGEKASYSGVSTLVQKGVLVSGEKYQLTSKISGSSGSPPVLSSKSSSLPPIDSALLEGENTLEFIAISDDFTIETMDGTSGNILELSLIHRPKPAPVFDFAYNIEHQKECSFVNLRDDDFTWQNARQNIRQNPIRRWVLNLELTPDEAKRFDTFFVSQRGRYGAFSWVYGGENLTVRFDTDKIDQKQYPLGYRQLQIPIIEVAQ